MVAFYPTTASCTGKVLLCWKAPKKVLAEQGFNAESCAQITWGQCALLDESVLYRPNHATPNSYWLSAPLQVHFFRSMDAG